MIPYNRHVVEEDDVAAVCEAMRSDWLSQGPKVAEFEKALAVYCTVPFAIVFSSGTAALEAAYFSAGINDGDEIITTPLTFVATASAALWQGARPVFCDVDIATGNIDVGQIESLISPRTKAIVPVDYAGRPVDYDALTDITKRHGLLSVADASHSLGATYRGRKVGSLADLTVLSFQSIKTITTGEGGAVLTRDRAMADRLYAFRMHGITRRHDDWRYEVGELGHNYRLTDIQCALGVSQLRKVDRFVRRRLEIAREYLADFMDSLELIMPLPAETSSWHLFPVRLRLDKLRSGRAEIFKGLRDAGIGVQVHYIPVHLHPMYQSRGYSRELCPRAVEFYESEISLPIFPTLSDKDRKQVVVTVKDVLSKNA